MFRHCDVLSTPTNKGSVIIKLQTSKLPQSNFIVGLPHFLWTLLLQRRNGKLLVNSHSLHNTNENKWLLFVRFFYHYQNCLSSKLIIIIKENARFKTRWKRNLNDRIDTISQNSSKTRISPNFSQRIYAIHKNDQFWDKIGEIHQKASNLHHCK